MIDALRPAPQRLSAAPLTFNIRLCDQLSEISVANHVLTQQYQTEWPVRLIQIVDLEVYANNGLDAVFCRLPIELHQREHVSLIGQRDRGHALFDAMLHQHREPNRAIDDGILGVQMQMYERAVGGHY